VTDEERARLLQLCEQAAKEMDPQRLLVVVQEINQLLEEKKKRLQQRNLPGDKFPA
jgi:hypothetical protein